jgi:carbon storage regulator
MLVVSRKPGEEVVIGDQIIVTVVAVDGARVRLGITAPAEVPIRREELGRSSGPPAEAESAPQRPVRPRQDDH